MDYELADVVVRKMDVAYLAGHISKAKNNRVFSTGKYMDGSTGTGNARDHTRIS